MLQETSGLEYLPRLTETADLSVEAPVCIVTGGARGIGRAIAEMLGATGAKVVCAICTGIKACQLQFEDVSSAELALNVMLNIICGALLTSYSFYMLRSSLGNVLFFLHRLL